MKGTLKKKWLVHAISGLVLTGFGLSLLGEASFLKHSDASLWDWVMLGTLSLVVFNSGLCFFGQAVIYRIRMDRD